MEKGKELDIIVSEIVRLSLEEKSPDPVRNIYSICINLSNKIEAVMCRLRDEERRKEDT